MTVLVPALHSSKAASMSNDDQIRALVAESWGQIAGRIDEIGVAFFLKVFEIAPEALQLFSFRDVNPRPSTLNPQHKTLNPTPIDTNPRP